MKSNKKLFSNKRGFTLVEVLVSLGIIAILIGLLIPAVGVVHDMALDVKQTMQFTGIEMALEAFMADSGYNDYPPSNNNTIEPGGLDFGKIDYTGAMKLAEALVGMDAFGWHPDSIFRTFGVDASTPPVSLYRTNNLRSRKGPYLELETANAVKLGDIYSGLSPLLAQKYVLTDVYSTATNLSSGKSIGMPILYYRANTAGFYHSSNTDVTLAAYYNPAFNVHPDHVYEYLDNKPGSGALERQPLTGADHPMFDKKITNYWTWFYMTTSNPDIPADTSGNAHPYKGQSFILQSAGPDGLYGTADDKFNFEMSN